MIAQALRIILTAGLFISMSACTESREGAQEESRVAPQEDRAAERDEPGVLTGYVKKPLDQAKGMARESEARDRALKEQADDLE